jgi:hypothetical protein
MSTALNAAAAQALRTRYLRAFGLRDERATGRILTAQELAQERQRDRWDRKLQETWQDNPSPDLAELPRSKAFLAGYVALCGIEFSADAIECADGRYIRPDMQVMKAFCGRGDVIFDPATVRFRVSIQGEQHLGLLPASSD